jgi:hypothetical protein
VWVLSGMPCVRTLHTYDSPYDVAEMQLIVLRHGELP